MKKWHFKIKNNPREIIKKIESTINPINGLVFNMNLNKSNNLITFKMRKRILYPWYLFFLNSIIVNGKLSKTETENESKVEITFNQHFLWVLVVFTHIILGLALFSAVISEKTSSIYMCIIGALILGIGIILWIRIQIKYKRNIEEYKTLISEILEIL